METYFDEIINGWKSANTSDNVVVYACSAYEIEDNLSEFIEYCKAKGIY